MWFYTSRPNHYGMLTLDLTQPNLSIWRDLVHTRPVKKKKPTQTRICIQYMCNDYQTEGEPSKITVNNEGAPAQ